MIKRIQRWLCERDLHNYKPLISHPAYTRVMCKWCRTKDYRPRV